jgi:uncharacterized protein YbjT (DUF2867 family)
MSGELHAVTGAFGYSGKYITTRLLAEGRRVRTLTNSLHRQNPFGDQVRAFPFNFDNPRALTESLRGVEVLYNTYWVRFNYSFFNHESAVQNSFNLIEAAQAAGVRRVVYISITHPNLDSPLEYFSGKARIEQKLIESGLSYAILRPTVLFGKEDILINNIAWSLRRLPVFGLFGDGSYKLQPVYVDDVAARAVEEGKRTENVIVDATGPETFSYRELVEKIEEIIGRRRPILPLPPALAYASGWVIGKMVNDVLITWPEVKGLMQGLLWTDTPSMGTVRLTDWARQHRDTLGMRYASELARRKNREKSY